MLQLVTGRAGSGKSEYCMQRIEQLAREGRHSILVVPEQSSFEFERALTLRLGDRLAPFAEIKSFRSLCADIFTECGGGARRRAGDAVRCSLVRRAVTLLGNDIVCFKRHRRDMSFFALTSSVIDELKNAGVSPAFLSEVAEQSASTLSAEKLREIAQIYAVYETLLETRYHDNASETTSAAQLSRDSYQFNGKTLFFDGFTGFTEPQFTLLGNLMQRTDELCVTLCCDDILSATQDAFVTVRKNGRRLIALAKENDVPVVPAVHLDAAPRFAQDGLQALECFLADDTVSAPSSDGVYQIAGADRYDELAAVADEILTLIREQGYHYSDIVVVARDIDVYRAAVQRTFGAYDIPFFCDTNRNLLYTPVTAFILAALGLAGGITSEGVLQLLKTGLTDIDADTVAELENYLFIWNIDRGAWFSPFTQSPSGFGDAPPDTALLERLEQARGKITGWLFPLNEAAKESDGGTLVQAVYAVMKRSGALHVLETLDEDTAREASAGLEMLDALYTVLSGDAVTPAEARDMAALMAASTPIGDIPPTLEQVSVGTADRMRTDNPRAVFAIGLNDGVFPHTSFDTPLLTGAERDLLAEAGAALTRSFENSAVMEELYLYRALTCATERVYLCRAGRDSRGSSLMPTPKVQAYLDLCGAAGPDSAADPGRFVVNEATAAQRYAGSTALGEDRLAASIAASDCGVVAQRIDHVAREPAFLLEQKDRTRQLLGDSTTLSATRVEDFSKCRFRYFVERMLRIRPIKKAEISPLEAGNFVHGVLEQALRQLGGDIADTDKEQLAQVVETVSEQYIEEVLGAAAMTQPRIRYLTERLKAQSLRLLLQLKDEQQQSLFRPVDFELSIGKDGDVPPLTLMTPDGHSVTIQGKVDRVDLLLREGKSYIRVVDYKTGVKEFDLNDVYYGISVQMLLYLFTITQNGADRYADPVPAAVMYMPADPRPVSDRVGDVEAEAKKAYRMDGIVLDDPDIVTAMEREVQGVYIPVEYDKKGGLKTANLASLEKLGRIRQHIEGLVVDMARTLYDGDIEAQPIVDGDSSACDYCDYAALCRRDRSDNQRVMEKKRSDELFSGKEGGHGDEMDR